MSVTIAEVLKALVDKVHGWGAAPDHLAAIEEHFGTTQKAPEEKSEPPKAPEEKSEPPKGDTSA